MNSEISAAVSKDKEANKPERNSRTSTVMHSKPHIKTHSRREKERDRKREPISINKHEVFLSAET